MKEKRKFTYWQKPIEVYEIAECRHCGGRNCTYSEWAHLMWCFDCKKEYRPSHWGVFDGPIPIGISHSLGMFFHRVEISTGRLIKEDDPDWEKAWP